MLLKILKGLDMFGAPLPNLNINGETKVKTFLGAIVSIIVITITFAYSLLKLEMLIQRKNPSLTTNVEYFDSFEEPIDMLAEADSMMMAFAVLKRNWDSIYDPKFFRFAFELKTEGS